ncbi:MAG: hypothetical protein GY928_28400 [Colwellia sp.]|nr:hypothetical protein [Colwellia sp.]
MANPFAIDVLSGQRGINQGLQNLGNSVTGFFQQQQAQQQQQAAQDRRNQFAEGLQSALGSESYIKDLTGLMARYPEYAEEARKVYGFTNEQTENIARQGYLNAYKNPEQATQILNETVNQISAAGGNPMMTAEDAMSLQGKSPEEIRRELATGMIMIDPKIGSQLLGQQEKPMDEYQKVQTDLRRLENQERALDRQVKREQNELKKQELQLKLDETRSQKEQSKQADQARITDAVQDAQMKQQTIDDLLKNNDYIDSLTGYTGRLPATTDAGLEAEAFLDNIKNSMTIENLGVMSGPLTDKDIQIIASASSRLKAGMSEKVLRQELSKIKSAYDRVIKNFNKEANRKGYQLEEQENSLAGKGPNAIEEKNQTQRRKPITIGRFQVVEG